MFLDTLARHRPDPDRTIPVQLRRLMDLAAPPAPAQRSGRAPQGRSRATAAGMATVSPDVMRKVKVRSGPGARAALEAAGRPAATVGDTIYLARPPDSSRRSAEILAHELVHAARPSGRPRFFADDHHSEEETAAVRAGGRMAGLMRTFEKHDGARPGADHLTFGTGGLAVAPGANPLTTGAATAAGGAAQRAAGGAAQRAAGGAAQRAAGGVVQRAAAGLASGDTAATRHGAGRRSQSGRHRPGSPSPDSPGSNSFAGGSSVTGAAPPGGLASRIQRLLNGAPPAPPMGSSVPKMTDPSNPMPGDRPFVRTVSTSGGTMIYGPSDLEAGSAADPGAPLSAETLDWIVERVEERILAELERRGIGYKPGVF